MQGLVNNGELCEEKPTSVPTDHPTIWREPIIFLRPRFAGLNTTIDFILEDLESEVVVPEGLSGIVGVETETTSPSVDGLPDETAATPPAAEPDILFSKPANSEQYEI